MAYWICRKCKLYQNINGKTYKINRTCKCGGILEYHDKLPSKKPYIDSKVIDQYKIISPSMKRLIRDYESVLSRMVLLCIQELPFFLGIKRIILILKGSQNPFIKKYNLDQLETYSILSNFTQDQMFSIIESLINKNFLKLEHVSLYSDKPVSSLTDEGLGYRSILKLTSEGEKFIISTENMDIGFLELQSCIAK